MAVEFKPPTNFDEWLHNMLSYLCNDFSLTLSQSWLTISIKRMVWQWAETLVEIRGTLADIRGTTK